VDPKRRRKRDLVAPAMDMVRDTVNMALNPRRFIEFGSDTLDMVETGAEGAMNAVEFLISKRPGKTILHGEVSGEKKIDWIEPVPLQQIKDIGRAAGATVNDVLLAVLTNALRKYLVEKDALTVDELFTAVPVSLRKPDAELPRTLGNRFGLIPVLLPVSIEDPVEQLHEVKRRIDHIKDSQMPFVSFGLTAVGALATPEVDRLIHRFNQDHSIGVTTNVPGPRHEIYMAGGKVVGMWGMGGLSANMNMSFGLFSLNNEINFAVHSDVGITDDPERILDLFLDSIEQLRAEVLDAGVR
jgi:WS/DGAT/MGAT family acyltransferase